jgi:agmatinase
MSNKFIGCDSDYADASAVLFGAPFDSTSSYRPGSRFAPAAVRNESYGIETYSPALEMDLEDICVYDAGDPELPFGDTVQALDIIERRVKGFLDDGKLPVMLGGEHLVTLGAVRAAAEKYPDLRIAHFDAHADLRDEYLGVKLSHASVIRRCWELTGDGRVHQFGIRSGTREEFLWAREHTLMRSFDLSGIESLRACGAPVYLSVDLDVLDPGVFPGTGTPEAGGVSYTELLSALREVTKCDIVGTDLVELSPPHDAGGRSTLLACTLLRELLLMLNGGNKKWAEL